MEDLASPVVAFVRDRCAIGAEERVDTDRIFGAWQGWCRTNGHKDPGSNTQFGSKLRDAFGGVKRHQPREGGIRLNQYSGIGLLQTAEDDDLPIG
jgi:putative DNA primase/helicase